MVDAQQEAEAEELESETESAVGLSAGIPEDRRVAYTILFLAGLREGEMAALRWEHYDTEADPLGRLLVAYSYSTRLRAVKRVKTKIPRDVPVHPTLADVLSDWGDVLLTVEIEMAVQVAPRRFSGFQMTRSRHEEGLQQVG